MHAGRSISKAEALLVIAGWRDSSALIKCNGEVAPLAFAMRGRIVEFVLPNRVRFLAENALSEFAFILRDDFECWYMEPRDFPEEAEKCVCALTFFFPSRPGYASDRDFIALTELK